MQWTGKSSCYWCRIRDIDNNRVVNELIGEKFRFGNGNGSEIGIDLVAKVCLFPLAAVHFEFIFLGTLGNNGQRKTTCHLLERGNLYGRILVDVHITKEHVPIVLHIQTQRVDHNFHYSGWPEFVRLIGYIVDRVQSQIAECHWRSALGTVLWTDQDRRSCHIKLWLGFSVEVRNAGTYNHGQDKPVPVVGTCHEQAVPLDTRARTFFLFLFGGRFCDQIFLNDLLHI